MTGPPAYNFNYVYDRWGNRWQQNGGSPAPNLSFNTSTNQVTNSGFAYDAAGDMTSDGTHSYSYDADGNLIKVDGGSTATYTYDALNHRVRTQNTGQDNYEYIFNPSGQRISIWDASYGWELEGNSYWGSAPVEFYDNGIAQFQHQDWLGTERMATDNNGTVEGTYTSLPFGDGLTTSGSDNDAYHFAGLDYDFSSGTYHAQFRQYYPTSGQWISPDLFAGSYDFSNPQSLNRYSYVLNNPLSAVDPAGLDGCGPSTMGCPGPPIGIPFCFIFCFGGGPSPAHGVFHGFVGRPNASPWDEYHIHYGADIADALGLPDAGCEFGACGFGSTDLANAAAPINLSPWIFYIFGLAHAPSNPAQPPQKDCGRILSGAALTVGLDAAGVVAGAIPGSGAALVTTQVVVGLAGAANAAYHADVGGTFAGTIVGAQLAPIAAVASQVGWSGVARALPAIGSIVSARYFYKDATQAIDKYRACKAGIGG